MWTPGADPVLIYQGYAEAISDDGTTIVGSQYFEETTRRVEASAWTVARGPVALGVLKGYSRSSASAVSSDGKVVAGNCVHFRPPAQQAFRWTAEGGMIGLGTLGGAPTSEATGISADGSVIVGASGPTAVRWTAAGGMQAMGHLREGTGWGRANGVSADGATAVGEDEGRAFIWDAKHGMRDLKTVLERRGLNAKGWTLLGAQAISPDGTVICGWGTNPQGAEEDWIAVLPWPGGWHAETAK